MDRMKVLKALVCALALTATAAPAAAFSDDFIINGIESAPGSWPWQVRITYGLDDRSGICGGSLIAPEWVLSAAHCFTGSRTYAVGYGSTELAGLTLVEAAEIVIHPDYKRGERERPRADLALVRLARPVEGVATVPLAGAEDEALSRMGGRATVTGWGATLDNKLDPELQAIYDEGNPENLHLLIRSGSVRIPPRLREAELRIFDLDQCRGTYALLGRNYTVHDTEICASMPEQGRDSCQGDSGGPLMARSREGHIQIGIVSWGYHCGHPAFPGVYARVSAFRGWIDATMAGERNVIAGCASAGALRSAAPLAGRQHCEERNSNRVDDAAETE